jgi:hypothetical protein
MCAHFGGGTMTTTTTAEVAPLHGTCPRCGRPTAIRAAPGPPAEFRLVVEECCPCGYRQDPSEAEMIDLEGSPGPVPAALREMLDAPPIVAAERGAP